MEQTKDNCKMKSLSYYDIFKLTFGRVQDMMLTKKKTTT